jgi:hypothetical protein
MVGIESRMGVKWLLVFAHFANCQIPLVPFAVSDTVSLKSTGLAFPKQPLNLKVFTIVHEETKSKRVYQNYS